MSIKPIANVLLLLASIAAPRLAMADSFRYSSYASEEGAPIAKDSLAIDVDHSIHFKGHAGVRIKICDESAEFACFSGPALSFAVPRHALAIGETWAKDGRSYAVLAKERIALWGSDIEVSVIESEGPAAPKSRFFYSPCNGLVAIGLWREPRSRFEFYYSESSKGFPFKASGNTGCGVGATP
jgi:hypothetical protein